MLGLHLQRSKKLSSFHVLRAIYSARNRWQEREEKDPVDEASLGDPAIDFDTQNGL
jgi:hypothetical protein